MDLRDAIETIRPGVYQVQVRDNAAPTDSAVLGTAFLVNDEGHLVTALHVVQDEENPPLRKLTHYFAVALALGNVDTPQLKMRANFVVTPVAVIAADVPNDLAVLKMTVPPAQHGTAVRIGGTTTDTTPKPVSLATDRPAEGEAVAVSGYPLGEPAMVTTAGAVASSWAWDRPRQHDRYLGDFTANPGNSGGPVYRLSDGGVIGVCVAGRLTDVVGAPEGVELLHSAALTVIVPSQAVAALLTNYGVPFIEGGLPDSESAETPDVEVVAKADIPPE